jgi:hypothetical protein
VNSLVHDKPWTLAISPLAALVPFVTAAHWLNEILFCKKWSAHMRDSEKRTRLLWDVAAREHDLFPEHFGFGPAPESCGTSSGASFGSVFGNNVELGMELSTSA